MNEKRNKPSGGPKGFIVFSNQTLGRPSGFYEKVLMKPLGRPTVLAGRTLNFVKGSVTFVVFFRYWDILNFFSSHEDASGNIHSQQPSESLYLTLSQNILVVETNFFICVKILYCFSTKQQNNFFDLLIYNIVLHLGFESYRHS